MFLLHTRGNHRYYNNDNDDVKNYVVNDEEDNRNNHIGHAEATDDLGDERTTYV